VRPVRRRERVLVPREELGRTLLAEARDERVAKVIDPYIGRVRTAGPSLHGFRFVIRCGVGRSIDWERLGALHDVHRLLQRPASPRFPGSPHGGVAAPPAPCPPPPP